MERAGVPDLVAPLAPLAPPPARRAAAPAPAPAPASAPASSSAPAPSSPRQYPADSSAPAGEAAAAVRPPPPRASSSSPDDVDIEAHVDEPDEAFVLVDPPLALPAECGYLPFCISRDLCREQIRLWLREQWFAPSDLLERTDVPAPEPCFVPFYSFTCVATTSFSAVLTSEAPQTSFPVLRNRYTQLLACASLAVDPLLIGHLLRTQGAFSDNTSVPLPEHLQRCRPAELEQRVLAVDLGADAAFERISGRAIVERYECDEATALVERKAGRGGFTGFEMETTLETSSEIVLLPVFLACFVYAEKTEVVVSGNKGKVVGNVPTGSGALGRVAFGVASAVGSVVKNTLGW